MRLATIRKFLATVNRFGNVLEGGSQTCGSNDLWSCKEVLCSSSECFLGLGRFGVNLHYYLAVGESARSKPLLVCSCDIVPERPRDLMFCLSSFEYFIWGLPSVSFYLFFDQRVPFSLLIVLMKGLALSQVYFSPYELPNWSIFKPESSSLNPFVELCFP